MRQKVAIIQAFMNHPDLIIMDEPTNGLDPLVQQTFMDMLREEASHGTTIFMSSHVLSEVEKACNRVAIIKEGRIVAEEQVEALRQKSGKVLEVRFGEPLTREIFYMPGISNVTRNNGSYRMNVTGNMEEILQAIAAYKIADINIHQMTLEDVFMHYYEEAA
jgi:ABC-2 type transport system ATP-binding protein